jgi:Zn-dependent protease
MRVVAPRHSRFDLRLPGVPVRVSPGFWASAALLGIWYYADPTAGGVGYFLFWIAVAFVSLLLHELAHVAAARFFGVPAEGVLYGLGTLTLGVEALERRGQRLLVLLAGPLASLAIVALVWALTFAPFPQTVYGSGGASALLNGLVMIVRANFYWLLLNLVPLWPLDGGRILCELGEALLGRIGVNLALVLCLVATAVLTLLVVRQLAVHLEFRYDPRYSLFLQSGIVKLAFCFLLWLRTVLALWGPPADSDVFR